MLFVWFRVRHYNDIFTLTRPKMLNVLVWRHDDVIGAIVIDHSYKVCLFAYMQSKLNSRGDQYTGR